MTPRTLPRTTPTPSPTCSTSNERPSTPVFAWTRAVEKQQEAQENLDTVLADSESTAQDVARANLDLAEATMDVDYAADEVRRNSPKTKGAIEAIATALGISEEEARNLILAFEDLDGKTVDIYITEWTKRRDLDPNRDGGRKPGRAAGGPVEAGEAYIVGERGEEVFVPDQDGSIVPNHKIRRGRTAAPSGSQPTVVVDMSGATFNGSPPAEWRQWAEEISKKVARRVSLDHFEEFVAGLEDH